MNASLSNLSIILASGSPRRRELLTSIGLNFEIIVPDLDEEALAGALTSPPPTQQWPEYLVSELSRAKAMAVAERITSALQYNNPVIIAADTTVAIDGMLLGKPMHAQDAARMLSLLQGRVHSVWTGISVWHQGHLKTHAAETRVWFQPMDQKQIYRYIATGEPLDKAGAYAIQGMGSLLIERIEGCYFNVVGLSLTHFCALMSALGIQLI